MLFVSQIYLFSGELKNNLEEICTNSLFGAFSGMLNGVCKIVGLVWRHIAMVYREYSYAAQLVHLCCPFGARVLPLFWHYYS